MVRNLLVIVLFTMRCGTWHGPGSESCDDDTVADESGGDTPAEPGGGGVTSDAGGVDGGSIDSGLADAGGLDAGSSDAALVTPDASALPDGGL